MAARARENGLLRFYRGCLSIYPAEFREEYARELCLAFLDRWREEPTARTCWEAFSGIFQQAPKEHCDVIFKDLQYAVRILRKELGMTVAAIAILALGIGATTLVFSLANGLLLRPLPYRDPARLMAVSEYSPTDVKERDSINFLNYVDYKARARLVENVGVYNSGVATLRGANAAEVVPAGVVSDGVLRALGVAPLRGRIFTPEESAPGGPRVILLGEELWTRRYARDPEIVGKSIDFGSGKRMVVGIMPAEFHFPGRSEIWVPEQSDPAKSSRTDYYLSALARLKPGVSVEQAQAEWASILGKIQSDNPVSNNHWKAQVTPLHAHEAQNFRKQVIVLLVAVALLLAIACANVSNLLLVKASGRGREMAVRIAMGASRRRLVRQLASESLLLGLVGGVLGTALAYAALPAVLALVPEKLPSWLQFSLDIRVLVFSFGISLLTSLVFGLAPAFSSMAVDLNAALKEGGRAGSGGARHKVVRNGLVVGEVALSVMLLAGAGLTVRSFLAMRSQHLGYNPEHVLKVSLGYPVTRYPDGPKSHEMIRRLTEEMSNLPGVISAAFSSGGPLADGWTRIYTIEGRPKPLQEMPWVNHVVAVPGYFRTLGIPLLEGRDFNEEDYEVQHRIVVTSGFARLNWPGESAIGKHVRFGPPSANAPWNEVIGVVADNRYESLQTAGRPVAYLTYSANFTPGNMLLRTAGDPAKIVPALRARMMAIDKDIALTDIATLPEIIEQASWRDRFLAVLFFAFAVLALTLASVGLYAVLSYTVSLYSREIGIRMALGASRGSVRGMLLRQGMTLAGVGLALGLAGALGLTRLLESQLFGVSPHDPVTYVVTPLVLLTVAAAAAFAPAYRATRVDPAIVLRCE